MNEDWDDMTVAEPLAGEELERMLARYARVRLDPGQAQVRHARAAVMEEAWRRRIAATAPVHRRRGLFAGWSARRLGVSLSAAVVAGLMLGTSVFAASRAGGPLYEARLAVEALALPSDAAARVDAQLSAAQTRLAEAVEAAGRTDEAATFAALEAYDRVIEQLVSAEGAAADRALEAVQFHHSVLLEIATRVPDAAASGISRALTNSELVIERLAGAGAGGNDNAGGPGEGPGGNGVPPVTRPTASPSPTDTPNAEPTGRPEPTKRPAPTPKPEATPKPEKTDTPETAEPTAEPTAAPTAAPTAEPTAEPTAAATAEPTAAPPERPERSRPPRPTPNPGRTDGDSLSRPSPPTGKP